MVKSQCTLAETNRQENLPELNACLELFILHTIVFFLSKWVLIKKLLAGLRVLSVAKVGGKFL